MGFFDKSKEVQDKLDTLSDLAWGRRTSKCLLDGICVCCGEPAIDFDDSLSRKEYQISGMCQNCQDGVFNSDYDEEEEEEQ